MFQMPLVELSNEVELGTPIFPGITGRHLDISNSLAGVDDSTLITRRQEASTIACRPAKIISSNHHHESWQVTVLASQAVIEPRTQARACADHGACQDQILGGRVNRVIVPHTADHTDVVRMLSCLPEKVGDRDTALTILLVLERAGVKVIHTQPRIHRDILGDALRNIFAVQFLKSWFWVPGINVTRATSHVEQDHVFDPSIPFQWKNTFTFTAKQHSFFT